MEDLQNRGWEAQLSELSEAQKLFIKPIELERSRVQSKEKERSHKISRGDGYSSGHSNNSRDIQNVLNNISVLVTLVGSENEFVRHSAGKTLVAVSEYLKLNHKKSLWSSIPVQLWDAINFSCKTASTKCMVNVRGQGSSRTKDDSYILSVKTIPETAERTYTSHGEREWRPVVTALEVLRSILKKGFDSNGYLQTYLGSLEENIFISMQNMMPDILFPSLEHELAWGAVLQLLHTAIDCLVKKGDEGLVESSFIKKVGEAIPALARVALLPHRHSPDVCCISSFLRHKFLQLMMGLSRWYHTQHTLAFGCLRALRENGADLIDFSLSKPRNSLEINNVLGSSFAPTLSNPRDLRKANKNSMTHLQCRALFLLFRVWLVTANELGLKGASTLRTESVEDSNNEGLATPPNKFRDYNDELPLDVKRCHSMFRGIPEKEQSKPHVKVPGVFYEDSWITNSTVIKGGDDNLNMEGLAPGQVSLWEEANEAIKEWLQLQSSGFSVENAQDLSVSLVSLYLDEDDMMIKMLLQLFEVRPLLCSLGETDSRDCGWIVKALAPLELFHALLGILAYDHTVLVDFLISHTTGTLFLQYLMQCLRLSINTWPDFQQPGAVCKGRDSSIDVQATRSRVSSDKAISCLLELKVAIERLHTRDLFPYKPLPLLRCLAMLNELQQRDDEGRQLLAAEAAIPQRV